VRYAKQTIRTSAGNTFDGSNIGNLLGLCSNVRHGGAEMSITQHAVPCDKFKLTENDSPIGLSFPCCDCQYREHSPQAEPCDMCGHNANFINPKATSADFIMASMTFEEMAQLLVEMAEELKVEIPSRPDGVGLFSVRMLGCTKENKQAAAKLQAWRNVHFDMVRC